MLINVSVIIPNYNHAKFLKQRIDSVLNQTFQDFELIILDDCSTDNSKEIIESYRYHPKVRHIVYNKENSGSTFKQWEKGISLAKGEYIWLAESDDWAHETFLTSLIPKLLSNTKIGIVYCDSLEVNSNGIAIGRWSRWQQHFTKNIWTNSFTAQGKDLNQNYHSLYNVIPNASSSIFKKKLYTKSIFKDKIRSLRYVGDWYTWFSIFEEADVYYHHETLNYFRCHSNTTRSNYDGSLEKVLEYYNAIKTFRKLNMVNYKKEELETRLEEIFEMWPIGIRFLLKVSVLLSIIEVFKVDKHIFRRILTHLIIPRFKYKTS